MVPYQCVAAVNKQAWRASLRQRRRAIDAGVARRAAEAADRLLAASADWQSAHHIGIYLPNDGELDTSPVIERAHTEGRQLYLPAVDDGGLRFLSWEPGRALVPNRFGIGEPAGETGGTPSLDMLLMPLVGWTGSGFRLGMGGGYFDRFLADPSRRPRLCLGVAYECQREDELEALREPWDQGVNGILTECALYRFDGASAC